MKIEIIAMSREFEKKIGNLESNRWILCFLTLVLDLIQRIHITFQIQLLNSISQ